MHTGTVESCRKNGKNGAVKSGGRPSFRLPVLLSSLRVISLPFLYLPSSLSVPSLPLIIFSFLLFPSVPLGSCLTFLRVFNWLPFSRVSCSKTLINEPSNRSFALFFLRLVSTLCCYDESDAKAEDRWLCPPLARISAPRNCAVLRLFSAAFDSLGHTIDRYPFPGGRRIFARQQDISGGNRPATLIDTGNIVTLFTSLSVLSGIITIFHECIYL